jgi:hypothetical protein
MHNDSDKPISLPPFLFNKKYNTKPTIFIFDFFHVLATQKKELNHKNIKIYDVPVRKSYGSDKKDIDLYAINAASYKQLFQKILNHHKKNKIYILVDLNKLPKVEDKKAWEYLVKTFLKIAYSHEVGDKIIPYLYDSIKNKKTPIYKAIHDIEKKGCVKNSAHKKESDHRLQYICCNKTDKKYAIKNLSLINVEKVDPGINSHKKDNNATVKQDTIKEEKIDMEEEDKSTPCNQSTDVKLPPKFHDSEQIELLQELVFAEMMLSSGSRKNNTNSDSVLEKYAPTPFSKMLVNKIKLNNETDQHTLKKHHFCKY